VAAVELEGRKEAAAWVEPMAASGQMMMKIRLAMTMVGGPDPHRSSPLPIVLPPLANPSPILLPPLTNPPPIPLPLLPYAKVEAVSL